MRPMYEWLLQDHTKIFEAGIWTLQGNMLYTRSSVTLEFIDENNFMVIGGFAGGANPIETGLN